MRKVFLNWICDGGATRACVMGGMVFYHLSWFVLWCLFGANPSLPKEIELKGLFVYNF